MTDTGPPYPFPPGAGSNAIGSFEIGVSPIGDIPPFDIWSTVISQYANSPVITQLVTNLGRYLDPTANIAQFYDLVMNVDTAQGYGLDVWGRIVGIARLIQVPTSEAFFGFAEGRPSWQPFNQAPFNAVWNPVNQTYTLSDTAYRKLILAKALANICDGSIPSINQILVNLFCQPWRGNAYVTEGTRATAFFGFAGTNCVGFNQAQFYDGSVSFENMVMTYTFEFELTPLELAIVMYSNVLPQPTGVKVLTAQI